MFKLAVLPGDGIGQEVTVQALKVLDAVKIKYNLDITYQTGLIGGCAIEKTGDPFPQETQKLVAQSDAVLLGAVGGPQGMDRTKRYVRNRVCWRYVNIYVSLLICVLLNVGLN